MAVRTTTRTGSPSPSSGLTIAKLIKMCSIIGVIVLGVSEYCINPGTSSFVDKRLQKVVIHCIRSDSAH